jgi:uncharacterized cupin superfamily protein
MAGVSRFNVFVTQLEEISSRERYRWRATQVGHEIGAELIGATLYELDDDSDWTFPYHFHYGVEEMMFVVAGTPTLRTAGGERLLEPGDMACFPSGERGAHSIRGPGRVLIVSTNRTPSISIYPDSDKVGVRPPADGEDTTLNFRRRDAVDYWDGE